MSIEAPRVFDCFTFYNEFDLLELRIEELWDVVDFFVIAEANITHQNRPKSFYLKDNWARVEKYASKIRHIMVEDMPNDTDTWVNERFQRACLVRGLHDLTPNDIVITSDCDEIPRAEIIAEIKNDINDYDRYMLSIPIFMFKLNYLMTTPNVMHNNIAVTRGRVYQNPQYEREYLFPWTHRPGAENAVTIKHSGWHFTYFGKTEFAINKIQSFAHFETNVPNIVDRLNVDKMIESKVGIAWEEGAERFEYARLDEYFPNTVLNNLEKYKDMIVPNATASVYDFYPEE